MQFTHLVGLAVVLALAACTSPPKTSAPAPASASGPALPAPLPSPQAPRNDGPDPRTPAELMQVPDAVPRAEPISVGGANKPYEVSGERFEPLPASERYEASGLASWYGMPFHGRKTAMGETFNMYAMTAAHRTLPLPSYARVSNPANGRSVIVRINDRGPFTPGRLIDLSYTAAVKLGIAGVATVRVERVLPSDPVAVIDGDEPPEPPKTPPLADAKPRARETAATPAARGFWVQLGAYRELQGAVSLQQQAALALPDLAPRIALLYDPTSFHRVQAGPFDTRQDALAAAQQIRSKLKLQPAVIDKR
jgi:rare lipoprotein A